MTLESLLDNRDIREVNPKGNQSWILIVRTDAEAEAPILWPPDGKVFSLEKSLMLGMGGQKMRWLDGITKLMDMSLSQFLGDGEGQGSQVCCSPWSHKESDTIEQQNWTSKLRLGDTQNSCFHKGVWTPSASWGASVFMWLLLFRGSCESGGTHLCGGGAYTQRGRACWGGGLTYAPLPSLLLFSLLSQLAAGEWGLAGVSPGGCCNGWHRAGGSQAGGVRLPGIFTGSLLEDLNHSILLYDFGMEIFNTV